MAMQTTWLVVNSASGSNDEHVQARLVDALAAAGAPPDRVIDVQADDVPGAAALGAGEVGLLVVFAGDGTVNSVLAGANGWDGRVLILPGGTANLLARALHGERGAEDIVGALGQLRTVRRHLVRCDSGDGFIELLAGPGAIWSDVRESIREGDVGEFASRGIEAVQGSIGGPRVMIAQPALGDPGGYAGVRMTPAAEGLVLAGYGAETVSDLVLQGVALLRRDYREGPHDKLGHAQEITCESSDGAPIDLMIDGERATGTAKMRFSLVELPLDLLASQE